MSHRNLGLKRCRALSGTGDSQRDSRESIRANHSQLKPLFKVHPADSHESLELPIRANHPIRANRANRFERITPLRSRYTGVSQLQLRVSRYTVQLSLNESQTSTTNDHRETAHLGWGQKKNNKQKTHKHFSDGPCGTIVPGTNPHPSQGQTGQNSDLTVELNRERVVCPRDGSHFVPGMGSHLSQRRFLFVPETVPPKMFMFIGFFRMRLFCLQLEASCLQWSFLLTVDNFSFFTYNWSFVCLQF